MARPVIIQTVLDYDYKANRKVKDWGEKIVQPDQTMTLKELLERHRKRQAIPDVVQQMQGVEMSKITFNDVNPLEKSPDPLTTGDDIKRELTVLDKAMKAKKKEADEKAKDEAKRESEAKKEADKEKPE